MTDKKYAPLNLILDYTRRARLAQNAMKEDPTAETNGEEGECYLRTEFPENGECAMTGETHNTHRLGILAKERLLKRHDFKFIDRCKED